MSKSCDFGIWSRRRLLGGAAAAALAAVALSADPAKAWRAGMAAARPNIVVILIDDMGFSDLGCFGSEIPTPNIDALSRDGLLFTQFYNTARCSCSRASLLTGTYPHQAGLGHLEAVVVPGSMGIRGKLLDRVVTAAEVLQPAGYFTAMAGKWHLGMSHGVGPWQRGFDRSLASPTGGIYFPDQIQKGAQHLFLDGRQLPSDSPEIGTGHWYSSDLFVDWGTKFLAEAKKQEKPFFLYLPFVGVHFPIMAPPEQIQRFRGHYRQNWDKLREARLARQKRLGIVAPDEILPDRLPNTYNWDKLSPEEQDRFDRIMATYAADVAGVDKAVGTLVDRLKAAGEFDNTLILLMSDNGGNAESGPDGRLNGDDPGGPKSTIFVGMNWATLQNTPFQYFKHFTEEGGISAPLIVHWPRGIDEKVRGTMVRSPSHLIDIMPTLVDVSGAHYPTVFKGHDIVPMQGRSLVPSFTGAPLRRSGPIFWEHEGNRAVRTDRWKLVARFQGPWELYDMSRDRSETIDLATEHPDIVKEMAGQWDAWARRSYVDPWRESYDIPPGGRPRENWGTSNLPRHPEAMDAMTPLLKAQYATPTP